MRLATTCARLLCLLSAWALPTSAHAETDEDLAAAFSSDQPGFASTTAIAARYRLTTETNVSASFMDERSGSAPNLSLRMGVLDWLEVRLAAPTVVVRIPDQGRTQVGLADPGLGLKFGGELHRTLQFSSVWDLVMPFSTGEFGSPQAALLVDLNVDWHMGGPFTLTPNLVARSLTERDSSTSQTRRYVEGGGSLMLTAQLTDAVGVYAQGYVLRSQQSKTRGHVGVGAFVQVLPTVQLDATFDTRVTKTGDPPTAALGTTVLW